MPDIGELVVRGLVGGLLVVAFAALGEMAKPKAFSGLFSSAPSVAVASLAITLVVDDAARARQGVVGMVLGSIAMAACCVAAVAAVPRLRAVMGSGVAWATWLATALGLYWAVFIGAK